MGAKQLILIIAAMVMFIAQFGRIFTSKTHMVDQSVLLVTAHPDDEVMFFGPTLMNIFKNNNSVNLLTLSTGDSAGLGEVRVAELGSAMKVLNQPEQNTTVVDDPRLPDSMEAEWDPAVVAQYVLAAFNEHKVDTVVTFDEYGVSGHSNHAAVSEGVLQASLEYAAENEDFSMLTLYSVPLWRKYLFSADGLLSRLITIPGVQYHVINSQTEYHWVRQAIRQHVSQMVWYRQLWTFFSRYMIVNDLSEVNFGRALRSTKFHDAEKQAKIAAAIERPIGTEGTNIQTSVARPSPTKERKDRKDRAVTRQKPSFTAPAAPKDDAHNEL